MFAKQAVITGPRQVAFQEVELHDSSAPNNAMLRTRASFISAGTELAMYAGHEPRIHDPAETYWKYPFKPGYANVAEVLAVGEGISKVAPGQRVFTFAAHTSHHVFNLWDWDVIEPIPDGLDDESTAAARMALVSITALQVADVRWGDWVVVYGLGAVGNLAAQLFQLAGCRVIGVDPVAARCDLAKTCGVEHAVAAAGAEADRRVPEIIGSQARAEAGRPDICVDAVGHGGIIVDAVNLVAQRGQVIVLGAPRAPHQADMSQVMRRVFSNWITIRGALEWRLPRLPGLDPPARHSSQSNLRLIFELIERGRLHVTPLISHRLPAGQIQQAYEGLLQKTEQYTGVVLHWR